MIKATALKPVTTENMNIVANVLTKRSQNIKIEYSQHADLVPRAVEALACKMLQLDADIRGLLNDLRVLYVSKREDFHLSMRGLSKEAKTSIIELFESLYGVMSEVYYCADCDVINGKLIYSSKAQMFITGQYMEIAIRKVVSDVLSELAEFMVPENPIFAVRDDEHIEHSFVQYCMTSVDELHELLADTDIAIIEAIAVAKYLNSLQI